MFFLQNHRIKSLTENNQYLRDKIQEVEQYSPDRIVSNVLERHREQNRILSEKELDLEITKEELAIEREKSSTIQVEMEQLATRLSDASSSLMREYVPREGVIHNTVIDHLHDSVLIHSLIYLPLNVYGYLPTLENGAEGQAIVLRDDAGMGQVHLTFSIDGVFCGEIEKRYQFTPDMIGNDFIETVRAVLSPYRVAASDDPMGVIELPQSSRILERPGREKPSYWLEVPLILKDMLNNSSLDQYFEKRENND